MIADCFRQQGSAVRFEWGPEGLRALLEDCAVVIVVDVLSFTTSIDIAVSRGAVIRPLPWGAEAPDGYLLSEANEQGWTLRPSSLVGIPAGTKLAVGSPNGGRLTSSAAGKAITLCGSLRNATAVGRKATELAGGAPIGVVAGGERWGINFHDKSGEGGLRPCVEDHLGAGAIISALPAEGRSPEAELAAAYWQAARPDLPRLLTGCASGRELIGNGHAGDVELAAQVDGSSTVPMVIGGDLRPAP
ncbi:hypothetical protein D5S17_22430 [Pseudonocardiaceae bacterium YIM PH 21723]|nr:hypothetical protein D5S17_22430 [Pseudonocardiaceae bacterium YIM PH 21723]